MSSLDSSNGYTGDTLASLRRELNSLKEGLGLLGLRSCSQCGTFFQRSDPKALLNCGEFVCYRCVVNWWMSKRRFLDTNEREKLEGKLVQWLVRQHEAKIVREPRDLASDPQQVVIIANCVECQGTGYIGSARCRYCFDGNLWVVLKGQPASIEVPKVASD